MAEALSQYLLRSEALPAATAEKQQGFDDVNARVDIAGLNAWARHALEQERQGNQTVLSGVLDRGPSSF